MAVNQNTKWDSEHVVVAATTGGGKSQLMRNEIIPPKRGQRTLLWDVDMDHKCQRFDNKREFLKAVKKALKAGGGFRIGWSGDDKKETFKWFCEVVWHTLDGRYRTNVVIEEVADLQLGETMPEFFRKIQVRGRKYGARVISTTQRCQEVPKMLLTQSRYRYIGLHDEFDAKYLKRVLGIPQEDIQTLEPLSFWCKDRQETSLVTTKWREFTP